MTRRLRGGKDAHGLILANGGVLTYQHAICLSSQPRKDRLPYPQERPLPEYTDAPHPVMDDIAEGAATIEVRRCPYQSISRSLMMISLSLS